MNCRLPIKITGEHRTAPTTAGRSRLCLKRLPLARERAALVSGKDGEAARFADLAMDPDVARGQMSRSKPAPGFSDRT